jgi:methyltransferase (TIGR00027 family)
MAIENVSDTARWVAVYRAMETARPDAIFRDPFADRLAGQRGHEITDAMKNGRSMAWPMIVRTAVFDEIILDAVRNQQVDLVVNLAAGLDARPWRMPLPESLHWVDVDLPGILNYKTETLKDEKPVCRYEAVTVDLRDVEARRALFARLDAGSKRALVISEGLLIYLTPEQVGALASDLHAQPSFREWLIDLASPDLLKRMGKTWGKTVAAGNAPFQFAPAESTGFFRPYGWREAKFLSLWEEANRLNRTMKGAWFWNLIGRLMPPKAREKTRRFSGLVVLERI